MYLKCIEFLFHFPFTYDSLNFCLLSSKSGSKPFLSCAKRDVAIIFLVLKIMSFSFFPFQAQKTMPTIARAPTRTRRPTTATTRPTATATTWRSRSPRCCRASRLRRKPSRSLKEDSSGCLAGLTDSVRPWNRLCQCWGRLGITFFTHNKQWIRQYCSRELMVSVLQYWL